ncbi:hypothetical protein EV122DRAFT_283000 [Schizophyllum commune]
MPTNTAAKPIRLAIFGDPGSGKKSLKDALDGSLHHATYGAESFLLEAELHMPSAKSPDMAVITLDATQQGSSQDIQSLVETSRTVSSAPVLCFVLTKMDLIPSGACRERIDCLNSKVILAESYDADTLFTSVVTREGIDELRDYIVTQFCPPTKSFGISESLHNMWNTCQSGLLDFMARCFSLPVAAMTKNVDEELATIHDDADLRRLRKSSVALAWNQRLQRVLGARAPENVPANRITDSLVVKWPTSSERACLEYVRHHTSVPVPRAFRPDLSSLVMDLIEGENLLECWGELSRFMQFRVACTLRLYVKQLRSLTSSRVGGPENGRVSGLLFQDRAFGPFSSTSRFRRFCEHVVFIAWEDMDARKCAPGAPLPPIPQCKGSWDPVFVHGDLNPSNLILDKRNTLWVVDWATAGFYPAFMESQTMRFFNDRVWGGDFDKIPRSWRQYREFIAGTTDVESDRFWDYFEYIVYRFSGDVNV